MSNYGRSYFPNLDGLRFFAFLHVFVSHAVIDSFSNNSEAFSVIKAYLAPGFFGIDFFFVLSGFLITWTLLEEKVNKRTVSFKNYMVRRSLRIWPLYFLIVTAGFIIFYAGRSAGIRLEPIPGVEWFALFILNFYISSNGPHFLFFLVFLWSISVEEQFYLLWGISMKWLRRLLPHICMIIILSSLYFRYTNIGNNDKLVFHSLSVAANFAGGALLAWNCFYRSEFYRTLSILRKGTWVRIYILIAVLYLLYSRLFHANAAVILEKLVFTFLFCLVLFDQCFSPARFFNAGSNRIIAYLGKISYGLYCFHGLVLTFAIYFTSRIELMQQPVFTFFITPIASALLTFLIAHLSYRYFEKPFLNIGKAYR